MNKFIPIEASAQGAGIGGAFVAVVMLMGMLAVGWLMYVVWVWFTRRQAPGGIRPRAAGRAVAWIVTGGVVAVELGMFAGVVQPMWRARRAPVARFDATAVRVIAQQYRWTFHYPGADGEFGDTRPSLMSDDNPPGLDRASRFGADDIVASTLHVPVGHPVVAELVSRDAVHSFGVPGLHAKQDVIPGVTGSVWFDASTEGVYDIQCSQLCGPRHAEMRGTVVVESAAAFRRFLAAEAARLPAVGGK